LWSARADVTRGCGKVAKEGTLASLAGRTKASVPTQTFLNARIVGHPTGEWKGSTRTIESGAERRDALECLESCRPLSSIQNSEGVA
jgi:hypothetical protein